MAKKRRSRQLTIAERERPWPMWSRFEGERTCRAGFSRLEQDWRNGNYVSCTIPAPCTHKDIVEQVAAKSVRPIPIDALPPVLSTTVLSRGVAIFGPPWNEFDRIAKNYPDLCWWLTEKGLRIDKVSEPASDEPIFYQIVGALMLEARSRWPGKNRLPPTEYKAITDQLADFKPLEYLSKEDRKKLADWNQKHPNRAFHTFSAAIEAKKPDWLRRAVQRCLYRAAEKFSKEIGLPFVPN